MQTYRRKEIYRAWQYNRGMKLPEGFYVFHDEYGEMLVDPNNSYHSIKYGMWLVDYVAYWHTMSNEDFKKTFEKHAL